MKVKNYAASKLHPAMTALISEQQRLQPYRSYLPVCAKLLDAEIARRHALIVAKIDEDKEKKAAKDSSVICTVKRVLSFKKKKKETTARYAAPDAKHATPPTEDECGITGLSNDDIVALEEAAQAAPSPKPAKSVTKSVAFFEDDIDFANDVTDGDDDCDGDDDDDGGALTLMTTGEINTAIPDEERKKIEALQPSSPRAAPPRAPPARPPLISAEAEAAAAEKAAEERELMAELRRIRQFHFITQGARFFWRAGRTLDVGCFGNLEGDIGLLTLDPKTHEQVHEPIFFTIEAVAEAIRRKRPSFQ